VFTQAPIIKTKPFNRTINFERSPSVKNQEDPDHIYSTIDNRVKPRETEEKKSMLKVFSTTSLLRTGEINFNTRRSMDNNKVPQESKSVRRFISTNRSPQESKRVMSKTVRMPALVNILS